MKREILYAAKTPIGEWVKGELHVVVDEKPYIHAKNGTTVTIIPETLCQYAGREDKYDEQIFEGDKLKGGWVVVWEDCCFWAKKSSSQYETERYPLSEFRKEDLEVVGSIHDEEKSAWYQSKFANGDILMGQVGGFKGVIIFKEWKDEKTINYHVLMLVGGAFTYNSSCYASNFAPAPENYKKLFFKRLKQHGKRWNDETLSIEEFTEEMKNGDYAIFWNRNQQDAFIAKFQRYSQLSTNTPYIMENGQCMEFAVKFQNFEQYERIVKGGDPYGKLQG